MNEQQQRELAERIADDERHAATMRRAADYDALMARTEAAEAEATRLQYDLDRQLYRADVLAARVAELEATLGRLDALAPDYELPDGAAVAEAIASGYILTAGCRDIHGKVAGVAAIERNNEMLRARVAELEAQLEEATQLLSIAIDRLPEEEQEIVALRWALSGTFTNELPTIAAPAAATLNGRKPTPEAA